MITEALRMVEAALLDGSTGLAIQVAALAMDTPNGSITPDTRPGIPAVRNSVDDDVSVHAADETFPILLVDVAQPAQAHGEVFSGVRDYELDVIVALLEGTGDVAANNRSVDYLLRATVKALARGLFANSVRATTGTRNGFVLCNTPKMRYGPSKQSYKGATMTGAVMFTINLRDQQP